MRGIARFGFRFMALLGAAVAVGCASLFFTCPAEVLAAQQDLPPPLIRPVKLFSVFYGEEENQLDDRAYQGYQGYGTDCSGLVSACAKLAGFNWGGEAGFRRNANAMYYRVNGITAIQTPQNLGSGDLVCWVTKDEEGRLISTHVAIVYRIEERIVGRESGKVVSLRVSYLDASGGGVRNAVAIRTPTYRVRGQDGRTRIVRGEQLIERGRVKWRRALRTPVPRNSQ